VLSAVVVDCREACGDDRDFALSADAIRHFEHDHQPIRAGSLVLACTGWDRFHADPARYLGSPPRFPGYAPDAAELLLERDVAAIGIDTLGVDRGVETSFPVHHITSPAGVWHIEGLVGLDRLPPTGATVVVGVLPLVDGSGAPARVLALVP
jgi:kynurenine formamidase